MAATTDDCVVETPMRPPDGAPFQGREAMRAHYEDFFRSPYSIEFDTEDMFATGDRYLVQWTFWWVGQDGSVRGVDLSRCKTAR